MSEALETLAVRLPPHVLSRLRELAGARGETVSSLVRRILEGALAEAEGLGDVYERMVGEFKLKNCRFANRAGGFCTA